MPQRIIEVVVKSQNAATPGLKGFKDLLGSIADVAVAPTRAIGGLIDVASKIGLAAIGVGALAHGLVDLGKSFTSPIVAASDLNESVNKAMVVFGQSSKAVLDFGATSAQSLGMSKVAAIDAAGSFGNLFTSLGFGQKQSADLSLKVVALGADLASFHNIRPEDALDKLRAGLVGEIEPLRVLGVSINEAMVKAEGLRMKLPMVGSELTEASKIQARYSLIMQQSTNAQGDFANTSDSMANAMRIINASFQDAQATIGEKFLPVVAPLVAAFSRTIPGAIDLVMPLIDRLAGAFKNVIQFGQEIAVMARNISGEYGLGMIDATLVAIEIRIREVFGDKAAKTFHDVVEVVKFVSKEFEKFATLVGKVFAGDVRGVLDDFEGKAREIGGKIIAEVTKWLDKFGGVGTAIKEALDTAHSNMQSILTSMTATWKGHHAGLETESGRAWKAINSGVSSYLTEYGATVRRLLHPVTEWYTENQLLIQKTVEVVFGAILSVVQTVLKTIADTWRDHGEQIKKVVSDVWAIVEALFASTLHTLLGLLKVGMQLITGDWSGAWETLKKTLVESLESWGTVAELAVKAVSDNLDLMLDFLLGFVGTTRKQAVAIGMAIADGIKDGLQNTWNGLVTKLTGLVAMLPAEVKQLLGISSPSRVFAEIGANITAGLAEGVEGGAAEVNGAMEQLATDMGASFSRSANLVEKENEDFQDKMESSETKYQNRLTDLNARLGKAKVTERKAILEQIANLERDHGRQVEDLAQQHADNLVDAEQRMARERGTALQDFARDVQRAERETGEALDQLNDRTGDAMASAIKDATRGIDEATRNATESIQKATDDLAESRILRGIRDAFGAGQDDASRKRSRRIEDADLKGQLSKDTTAQSVADAESLLELQRKRKQEDDDREYERSKDYGKAKTDDEKHEINNRFKEESADLKRRRDIEDKERDYQSRQRMDAIQRRNTEQIAELADRRRREDADIAFRENQERERVAFTDHLEDDALTKAILRTNTDRDNRIQSIRDALADKARQIEDDDTKERKKLNASHVQKIADLKEKLIDKIGPLLGDAQTAITTFLDAVDSRTALVTAGILAHTSQAAAALAGLGSTPSSAGGGMSSGTGGTSTVSTSGGSMGAAILNGISASEPADGERSGAWVYSRALHQWYYSPENSNSNQTSDGMDTNGPGVDDGSGDIIGDPFDYDLQSFATGGRVRGMPGEPRLVVAHGGETISPGGPADDTPLIIMLDGNAIMRSTWRRLKQQNLIGTNIGVT